MSESRSQFEPDELTGLPSLGKRIMRRTFDLTMFAVVAIGLVTIALRLSSWWQSGDDDPAEGTGISPQSQLPWGLGESGASLAFGDAPWLARHLTIMGLPDDVRARMVADCRQQLERSENLPPLPHVTAEETRLIEKLAALTPVAQGGDGAWQVYTIEGPLLAVFGIMSGAVVDHMTPVSRIVCWGIALPAGMAVVESPQSESANDGQPLWSAWMIDVGDRGTPGEHGPQVPCPEGAQRVLSIRDPHVGGIDSFRGTGTLADWRLHFEEWLREHELEELTWSGDARRIQTSVYLAHDVSRWRCDVMLAQSSETGEVECVVNLVEIQR